MEGRATLPSLLAVCLLVPGILAGRQTWQERQERQLADQISSDEMNIKMLSISVPGQPGQDYPILASVPPTSFRSNSEGLCLLLTSLLL